MLKITGRRLLYASNNANFLDNLAFRGWKPKPKHAKKFSSKVRQFLKKELIKELLEYNIPTKMGRIKKYDDIVWTTCITKEKRCRSIN